MSGQAVDIRATMAMLRRRRRTLALAAAVGVIVGSGLAVAQPPQYSSASQVLLPQPASTGGQVPSRDAATDIAVASSDVVLAPAGRAVTPRLSSRQVDKRLKVSAPASNVLQFRARSAVPAQAEALARAAARAEIRYIQQAAATVANAQQAALTRQERTLKATLATVNNEIKATGQRRATEDPTSTEGKADATAQSQLTAQQADLVLQINQIEQTKAAATGNQPTSATLIQAASIARRPGLVLHYAIFAAGGLVLAVLLVGLLLSLFGRRDRRLRFRDEIADALGSPVTASVRAHAPRSVAGWTSLLQTYEPETVDSWALRQTLRHHVFGDEAIGSRGAGRGTSRHAGQAVITVVSLSDDPAGLAMGPQLAAYAASSGIRTRLVAAQRHESAAALWAACHRGPGQEEVRPGLFVETNLDGGHDVDLTVVLAVVDREKPLLSGLPSEAATTLAVASGAATAEQLARTAVTADDAGARFSGLLVANPDDLDRTTGRLLQHERNQEVALPSRLSGMPSGRTTKPKSVASATTPLRRRRG